MGLPEAIANATQLRDSLAQEVERAREERRHISTLNAAALFHGAEKRAQFNADATHLQHALGNSLSEVASKNGLTQLTLENLAAVAPQDASKLSKLFAEIRSLSTALSEIDQLNRAIAERSLSCVESYLQALSFAPQAYDRRGLNLSSLRVRNTHSMTA